MSVAEKIGLLPGFGWIANQSWFGDSWWSYLLSTLLVCWGITPVGHVVWAFVSQAILVPLDSQRQWMSFFPGDLFLGGGIALLLLAVRQTDGGLHRWQSPWFHVAALAVALCVAMAMTLILDRPGMPLTALLSPSKLYHNFVLYGGYGYVAFVTLVAAIGGNWFTWPLGIVVLALMAASPWVRFVIKDGALGPVEATSKQQHAHPASYRLFWLIPIRGSYQKAS